MDKKDIILTHRKDIVERASKMSQDTDLLELLNYVHQLERGEEYKPFSMKRLKFLCNSNHNASKRYHSFKIPKKSGSFRTISAPSHSLMSVLKSLNIVLECLYTPSKAAMGFTTGRSVVDNAAAHVGMNYVLNLDLKDFFPSIHQARVWARLQLEPFNFPKDIANLVAGLCCMKAKDDDGNDIYVLPQGAPTSPLITNAICDKMDRRLLGLTKKYGVKYTRYADDITFSSMHNVYAKDGEFMGELRSIIESQNFTLNEAKTRLQKAGSRQEVTGLTVCEKPNVSRYYVRNIRLILHIWEKFGYKKAYIRFVPEYMSNTIGSKSFTPSMEEVLRGKIMYLKMVKGSDDPVFLALSKQYNALIERDCKKSSEKTEDGNLTYSLSYRLSDFEKDFGTKLEYKKKSNGKNYATCTLGGQTLAIVFSKALSDKGEDYIRKDKNLLISIASKDGKSFWIIRKPIKVNEASDLKLNIPVKELLAIWKDKGMDAAIEANMAAGAESIPVANKEALSPVGKSTKGASVKVGSKDDLLQLFLSGIKEASDDTLFTFEGTPIDGVEI